MNFVKAETPKRNENDVKIIAEIDNLLHEIEMYPNIEKSIDQLKHEIKELKQQLSLGYWIEVFGLVNLPINLDHVVTYEKDSFLKENILISQIKFETVRGDKYLSFGSEKERNVFLRDIF